VRQSRAIIIPSTLPAFSQTRERHIQPSRLADVTALPTAQPITALPKDLVDDGELVILLLRPSPLYIVLSSFVGLVMIALITFALAYLARLPWIGWTDRQAFLLGFGLASLRLGWQLLEWGSRLYVLTDRRIITRSGVVRLTVFQTQLKNVQHTSVFASLRERTTGLGTIGFATAGSDTFESFWVMIRQPFAVHKVIVETLRKYGG
jgi:hypothetical protein